MATENARNGVEFVKCAGSAAWFLNRYGVIDATDADGRYTGTVPFRLWAAQFLVVLKLATERQVLILKARQIGISWLVCGFVLWKCLFWPMQTVLLLSKGKVEAKELVLRVQKLYDRLPHWLKKMCPRQTEDNTGELGWDNGSRILSIAATESAGRTHTASVVVLDEADHMAWGPAVYESVRPTWEAGGQVVMLSTANGVGSLMHQFWDQAGRGGNDFSRVFLPWWSRPGRDAAWYERTVRNSHDPKKVKQEYPANALEAFLSSGSGRFEPAWLEAQVPNTDVTPLDPGAWGPAMRWRPGWDGMPEGLPSVHHLPGLRVYREPEQNHRYLLAADVAEGNDPERGDFDAGLVIDADTLEECAAIHGRWEPHEFAGYLMALSEPYQAVVTPERNNHGHAVIATMRVACLPRIGLGHDGGFGWLTNTKTKPQTVDLLAEHLKDRSVTVRTRETLAEMQAFVRKPGGRIEAREGYHDDRVMTWCVALGAMRQQRLLRVGNRARVGTFPFAGYRG